jgi:L-asparaginase
MIVIVFTGGTISMRHDQALGGAVPALSGRDILAAARGVEAVTTIEVDDFGSFPGPHMSPARMWALRARVLEHVDREDIQGVVIAHGTDTLEESAYLLARSTVTEKPIVFTGAMRAASELGWDGPANLIAAVRTAASAEACGQGVLVVMGERIFAGADVTKAHTHMLDAFESPGLGPLGVVDDGRVVFRRETPPTRMVVLAERLAEPVDIVYTFSGGDSRLLDASREKGVGVVVAALGRGNVPPEMVPGIERWIDDEKPVVITSRAQRGRVGPTYGYPGGGRRLLSAGAIFAGSRRPQQARIDLMLGLGAGLDAAGLRELFSG